MDPVTSTEESRNADAFHYLFNKYILTHSLGDYMKILIPETWVQSQGTPT